jgi:hypothetical protein
MSQAVHDVSSNVMQLKAISYPVDALRIPPATPNRGIPKYVEDQNSDKNIKLASLVP